MKWKKTSVFSVLVLMSILLVSSFVAAQDSTIREGVDSTVENTVQDALDIANSAAQPVFKWVFGSAETGGQLAIQVLAFLLVVIVVLGLLNMISIFGEDKKFLNFLIAIVVALIGIRFLPSDLLKTLAAPSSAFIAVLFLGIPFILMFFLLQKLPSGARRVGWVIFGVLIFILLIYNWGKYTWVYGLFLVAIAIAFWFDGTLQKWLGGAKLKRMAGKINTTERSMMLSDIQNLEGARRAALKSGNSAEAKKLLKQIGDIRSGL